MIPNMELHYFHGTPAQKEWVETQCPKHLLPQSVVDDMQVQAFREEADAKLEQRVAATGMPMANFVHVRVG